MGRDLCGFVDVEKEVEKQTAKDGLAIEFNVPSRVTRTRSAPGDVGLVSQHVALRRNIYYYPLFCL